MPLGKRFFARDTLLVARELLGKTLSRGKAAGIIVETEAYLDWDDPASHASAKSRKRSAPMFGQAGCAYVYFTYGNHWLFNIVTEKEGRPGAVLIRALEPVRGIRVMQKRRGTAIIQNLCSGPAKLAQALAINGSANGKKLGEAGIKILGPKERPEIECSPRIGISTGKEKPWRFCIKGNAFVSGPHRQSGGRSSTTP